MWKELNTLSKMGSVEYFKCECSIKVPYLSPSSEQNDIINMHAI